MTIPIESRIRSGARRLAAAPAALFALALSLVLGIWHFDVVFGARTFFFRDFAHFGYPLAFYHRESFWRGELPLWNPLNDAGLPFLAQWNTLVLYPGTLFYCLLPLEWSLAVYCLGHLVLGGTGMFILARRWTGCQISAAVAGLAFAVNGLSLNFLMWPNNVAALAWMPFVILCVEEAMTGRRRGMVKAILVGTLQMLCGAPEVIMVTWVLAAVLGGAGARVESVRWLAAFRRLAAVVVLVACGAAAQLLPFLDLLAHSQRDQGFAQAEWSMPSTGWANFLVPLFGFVESRTGVFLQFGQYWTSSYYLGIGATLLAVVAALTVRNPRVFALVILSALGLTLSLGDEGPFLPIIRKVFPAAGYMRFPIKLILLTTSTVPLLAAWGVRNHLTAADDGKRPGQRVFLLAGVTMAAGIGLILVFARLYPGPGEDWGRTLTSGISRLVILGLMLAWLGWVQRVRGKASWVWGVFLALMVVDVLSHAPRQNPSIPRDRYQIDVLQREMAMKDRPRPGEARALVTPRVQKQLNQTFTADPEAGFLMGRVWLFADFNLLQGIPKLDGFYSLYLRPYHELWSRLEAGTNKTDWSDLFNFLGVKQFTVPADAVLFRWQENTGNLPMVTSGQRPEFLDEAATLDQMSRGSNDYRRVVYLPPEAAASAAGVTAGAGAGAESRIFDMQFNNNQIRFRSEAGKPVVAVIAQSYYHRWKATVDGVPARLWRANHAFQAVIVPAGGHTVTVRYDDAAFRWGAWISGLTLVGCLGKGGTWNAEGGRRNAELERRREKLKS